LSLEEFNFGVENCIKMVSYLNIYIKKREDTDV
jgi:hypothetical protein